MNGKNLEGAYVGFEPFAYDGTTDQAMILTADNANLHTPFAVDVCRNVSQSQLDNKSRAAQAAENAKQQETPLPQGYSLLGTVKYADADIDTAVQEAALKLTDGRGLKVEVDGTDVPVVPRKSFAVPGGYLVVATGSQGDCHACGGVIQLYYLKSGDRGFESFSENGSPKTAGSWGQPAEVAIYGNPKASDRLMRLTTEIMGQGCLEKDGQLFRLGVMTVAPVGAPYSIDEGCPGK